MFTYYYFGIAKTEVEIYDRFLIYLAFTAGLTSVLVGGFGAAVLLSLLGGGGLFRIFATTSSLWLCAGVARNLDLAEEAVEGFDVVVVVVVVLVVN